MGASKSVTLGLHSELVCLKKIKILERLDVKITRQIYVKITRQIYVNILNIFVINYLVVQEKSKYFTLKF